MSWPTRWSGAAGVEAEAVWRDLVGRRPENGRHLGCYGRHLKERGRGAEAAAVLARAVAALREAIRLKPDDAPAHFNLGLILFESGDVRGRDRGVPRGDPPRPGAARPTPTSASPCTSRATCAVRSPRTARRSASSPTSPRPTPTSATP